jgi:hypothetical protein
MNKDSELSATDAKVKTIDRPKVPVNAFLRESVDGLGLKHEGVASDAGYKGDYWSLVLDGERGIKLDRLGCLPLELQRAFIDRWARALGMRFERSGTAARSLAIKQLAQALMALLQTEA